MNEVLNNIYTRRSIRKFKEQDVPKDLVDEIVKAELTLQAARTYRHTDSM